jgi:transcriptional regulator with XRE-family HTH domain
MNTIGEKAKEFRLSKRWNTSDMARAVGTSRQNIENLEAVGDSRPRYIEKLAKTMGVTVDSLISGGSLTFVESAPVEAKPYVPPYAEQLAHVIAAIPCDKKALAFNAALAVLITFLQPVGENTTQVHPQSAKQEKPF